jgi:hypothetical protein
MRKGITRKKKTSVQDNVKLHLRGICGVMDWIYLAQNRDRFMTCEHGNEPSVSNKILKNS